jgi:two-component system nitrate/nitrite response regulator NarL
MKFLLVDDHPMWRQGMVFFLRGHAAATAVLEAASGVEAVRLVDRHDDLDLALVDLDMRGMDGLETVTRLRERRPGLRSVVLSASDRQDDVWRSLSAGACGFISKSADPLEMKSALIDVMRGRPCVPTLEDAGGVSRWAPQAPSDSIGGLTLRQQEVLALMCQGQPNKCIAQELALTEKTVKVHIGAIFKALGVTNRTQAVLAAQCRPGWRPALA